MLVLTRKSRQAVMVGGGVGFERFIEVTVLEIASGKVKLGFEADVDIPMHRLEIWERMAARGELNGSGASYDALDERSD